MKKDSIKFLETGVACSKHLSAVFWLANFVKWRWVTAWIKCHISLYQVVKICLKLADFIKIFCEYFAVHQMEIGF